jgi:hypothetical protein
MPGSAARELDERLGLGALIERHLADPRTGRKRQFLLADLFRQSIYSRLAGYEDTNDAERLAEDPAFRMLASRERRETSVALTSTLHWFETEVLAEERNYQGLSRLNTDLVQHEATRPLTRRVTLDIDSSESPVHGGQEQSAYNGHFESVCYHPLFVFNQEGDCLAAKLRPGNVHMRTGGAAIHWTRLSCHRFQANEVWLLLEVIAYNLGNLLRRLVLPIAIQTWSLTSLQQRLFRTGGRLIRHARYFALQLAESSLTRPLFRQIVARIERLAWHPT